MKTKTKRILAMLSVLTLVTMNANNAFAAIINVGTGSVTTQTGNPITDVQIKWDDTQSTATGTISGVLVKATVQPQLNMTISNSIIDLGDITGITGSGKITIEVGTNSPTGSIVTATSLSGGLQRVGGTDLINSTEGGNYTFSSVKGTGGDASATYLAAQEINLTQKQVQIYKNTKVENLDVANPDIEFIVAAKAQGSAPAGKYEDKITFAVISNF